MTAWKNSVLETMQMKARGMGRFRKLILIPMVIFLFIFHLVFGVYCFFDDLWDKILSVLKRKAEKRVFRETTAYALTLVFFAFVVRISNIISGVRENDSGSYQYKTVNNAMTVISGDHPAEIAFEGFSESSEELINTYKMMKAANPDFIAWLSIDGTGIDYPVMYVPEEPERYLHKDFYGEDSEGGCLFIDGRCSWEPDRSDNIIVYGHNMADDSMFGTLTDYESESYYKEHPLIRLDTPEGGEVYEIIAAFYDRVYYADEDVFKFYDFIDEDDISYKNMVDKYLDKALYDTGITVENNDRILTLVTCSYQTENGRFVVAARKRE